MTYQEADAKLQGRCKSRRKIDNNTYLVRHENDLPLNGDMIAVRLHNTNIIALFRDGKVILNSGGWHTMTTKARLNRYGPVRIWTRRGQWHISDGQNLLGAFEDGMMINPDGSVMVPCEL